MPLEPDATQQLQPIIGMTHMDTVPKHDHDLPEHNHDPKYIPNTGVAIGLIWLSMGLLSIMFTWVASYIIGAKRWEAYLKTPDSDGTALVIVVFVIFVPIIIACVMTMRLIKK